MDNDKNSSPKTNTDTQTIDEKANREAMRAFLQRSEVRLSTMHRVASAFLGGAGLLILFPAYFGVVFKDIVSLLLVKDQISYEIVVSILLGISFLITMVLPIYSLSLLLRDLVHFYFVGHSPGFPGRLFNPRFVLSGIAFSPDESESTKKEIEIQQYSSSLRHFVLPFGEDQATYFSNVIESTDGEIIPPGRRVQDLKDKKIIEEISGKDSYHLATEPKEEITRADIARFNAAMGLAGVIDRPLGIEVAKMETSLIRHAIGLRRLVLRYIKALLMFILTMLISYLLVAITTNKVFPTQIVLAILYLIWSVLAFQIVKLPIRWIYEHSGDPNSGKEREVKRDPQLVMFEKQVRNFCLVSGIISALSIIIILIFKYLLNFQSTM
jgi:hypothetical protein